MTMEEALELDGEKLRQMTGQDHGPRSMEPTPLDIVLCTYPNTLDGCLAAWVVRKVAKTDQNNIPVEFSADPFIGTAEPEIVGRNWLLIGGAAMGMHVVRAKSIISFMTKKSDGPTTHPLPFALWQRTFPFGIVTMVPGGPGKIAHVHDASKSLSLLVWEFFYASRVGFEKPPRLIQYVNDFVTNTLRFRDTQDIVTCVMSYNSHHFQTLDRLVEACEDRRKRELLAVGGEAIRRYVEQQEDSLG